LARKRNTERVAIRINENEITTLKKLQATGDFPDKSATIRFCINFTKTILSVLPEAIGESYIETLEDPEYNQE